MIGSWAGELGQTQFLPSHYLKHAVDYDGDGRRNLMTSVADVDRLDRPPSSVSLGWQRGQPWLQEVRVPANLALGPGRPRHPASALQVGGLGRDADRRQAAAGRQPCRPRWCCRWAASARRSSPTRTSRSTSSGTSR